MADGWLGPNWSLAGFSRIERQSARGGVPSFDGDPEATDHFVIDGMRLWDTDSNPLEQATERATERAVGDARLDGAATSAWLLGTVTDPWGNTITCDYSPLPTGTGEPPFEVGDGAGAILRSWSRQYSVASPSSLHVGDEAWLCRTDTDSALACAVHDGDHPIRICVSRYESPPRPFRVDFAGCVKFDNTLELYPGDRVLGGASTPSGGPTSD
ncbi:MAG: hypothetical protein EXR71_00710 [Myxococcales bacterium]|nr:hypothetical protein [Myxococcales bacterium]